MSSYFPSVSLNFDLWPWPSHTCQVVKLKQHARYLSERSLSSAVIIQTHTVQHSKKFKMIRSTVHYSMSIKYLIYTIKTGSEFRNVSVTVTEACHWRAGPEGPAHRSWLGVVDTRSQPVANAGSVQAGFCCYSRQATRQTGLGRSP